MGNLFSPFILTPVGEQVLNRVKETAPAKAAASAWDKYQKYLAKIEQDNRTANDEMAARLGIDPEQFNQQQQMAMDMAMSMPSLGMTKFGKIYGSASDRILKRELGNHYLYNDSTQVTNKIMNKLRKLKSGADNISKPTDDEFVAEMKRMVREQGAIDIDTLKEMAKQNMKNEYSGISPQSIEPQKGHSWTKLERLAGGNVLAPRKSLGSVPNISPEGDISFGAGLTQTQRKINNEYILQEAKDPRRREHYELTELFNSAGDMVEPKKARPVTAAEFIRQERKQLSQELDQKLSAREKAKPFSFEIPEEIVARAKELSKYARAYEKNKTRLNKGYKTLFEKAKNYTPIAEEAATPQAAENYMDEFMRDTGNTPIPRSESSIIGKTAHPDLFNIGDDLKPPPMLDENGWPIDQYSEYLKRIGASAATSLKGPKTFTKAQRDAFNKWKGKK